MTLDHYLERNVFGIFARNIRSLNNIPLEVNGPGHSHYRFEWITNLDADPASLTTRTSQYSKNQKHQIHQARTPVVRQIYYP